MNSALGIKTDIAILGGGPGGYTAAFRAADLGKKVVIIERHNRLGGVCLNVGCIPSKILLHTAQVIEESVEIEERGVSFSKPHIHLDRLRESKDHTILQLAHGLSILAKQRNVEVIQGEGQFLSPHQLKVDTKEGEQVVAFEQAIIAAGSRPFSLPNLPEDSRIMTSSEALDLNEIPEKLLIIGGGIIGLEMAAIYHALGSKITLVEALPQLISSLDKDIVAPLQRRLKKQFEHLFLRTEVDQVVSETDGLSVTFTGKHSSKESHRFDRILVAIGRAPNGNEVGANVVGVHVDEKGFIPVDTQQRTNVPHLFAIGDIVGNPMLAHKSTAEGRIAAEVIAGLPLAVVKPRCIPSVAYTNPEIAWVGLTEKEAQDQSLPYQVAVFPWRANGRALTLSRSEGMTKLVFDKNTKKIIGGGLTGPHAGELISEITLAIEKECTAFDIAQTIHPHPTLSEATMMAAEVFEGVVTDLVLK